MESIEEAAKKAGALRKQSRRLLLFAAITAGLSAQLAQGQNFSEWFKQKSTQKKYLLQQVSALLAYRQTARNGYRIARGGLGSIGNYLGKEFQGHDSYYDRLKTVSSPVKDDPQVAAILRWQQDVLGLTRRVKDLAGLTAWEKRYVDKVCAALLKDCAAQLYDLDLILQDSQAEMGDEQRLRQLTRIHGNMEDNYRFGASFSAQVQVYLLQRSQENINIKKVRSLYEIDD